MVNYDYEGRMLCVDINLANDRLHLIVYVPTIPSERRIFIRNLEAYLITSRELIIGGDWNCVEDLKLDKMGGKEDRETDGLNEIIQIKHDFFLKDSFRTKYPKEIQFSFR